jgi:primosomal protein N' (replication factor Y) (superfamily II helicase)
VRDDRRETTLIGPTPCFLNRLAGLYRWQMVLRGPKPETLVRDLLSTGLSLLPSRGWRVEIDPISLL